MWVRPKTAKRTYRHAGSQLFLSSRVVTYFSSHFELEFAFSDVILITHSRAPLARTRHHRGTVGGTLWKFAAGAVCASRNRRPGNPAEAGKTCNTPQQEGTPSGGGAHQPRAPPKLW